MKGITDQEKAALYFQILERCEDWYLIYKLAIGEGRYNGIKETALQASVSRWKNLARIIEARNEIERNLKAWIQEERDKAIEEYTKGAETESPQRTTRKANNKAVDFLNRDEFLQFLNDRANEIQDDKTRNDILKMLSDNLRYKEADKEEGNDIQRFYTPLLCKDCELYKEAKTKLSK